MEGMLSGGWPVQCAPWGGDAALCESFEPEEKMFRFHKPKLYRSMEGCCICRAKSFSSRFTDSKELTYWKRQEICGRIIYKGRFGEVLIDTHLFKSCCSSKKVAAKKPEEQARAPPPISTQEW